MHARVRLNCAHPNRSKENRIKIVTKMAISAYIGISGSNNSESDVPILLKFWNLTIYYLNEQIGKKPHQNRRVRPISGFRSESADPIGQSCSPAPNHLILACLISKISAQLVQPFRCPRISTYRQTNMNLSLTRTLSASRCAALRAARDGPQ